MAGKAQSLPGKFKGFGVVRDKDGRPKVDRDKLHIFWKWLKAEDRQYLRAKYPDFQPNEE